MNASLTLVILMAVMYAAGVYVMLERSLTRILIGFLLVGNATNVLILLIGGPDGLAPIVAPGVDPAEMADPLPQALVLTAIVINFGVTAFLLALIHRSWLLGRATGASDIDDGTDDDQIDAGEVFRQAHDDDEAIAELLDASDETESAEHHRAEQHREDSR